ncbi:MAG TPA: PKD domain-containing protein [Gammaproteobacteria bacterium]|nr:PKD domain-containing protein [Gammaproteobacteria bacterium]
MHVQRKKYKVAVAFIGYVVWLFAAAVASADTLPNQPTPAGGTLSPASPSLMYTAGPFLIDNITAQANGAPICGSDATPCSDYTLTINLPSDYATTHPRDQITIKVAWPTTADDFDVYVLDASGKVVGTSASSADPETVTLPAGSGTRTLTVRTVPFTVTGDSYTGTVTLSTAAAPPPQADIDAPRYINYPSPENLGNPGQSEPSLGIDYKTGAVMYQALLQTLRVTFNDGTSPARTMWTDVSAPLTSIESLDPILFTDHVTGRTFVSQLTGQDSLAEFTDDDGATWTPSQGGGIPSGVDHQSVGGGPYASLPVIGQPDNPIYPHAVYYCSQDIATAFCARSDDGGLTFGPGVPIYNLTTCGGLHGHVKVGPEGTVYVPNGACGTHQGVAVSEDNGVTWAVRVDPMSSPDTGSDPSVGVSTHSSVDGQPSEGTIYLGYQAADNHARIAVSHDHGQTWEYDQDVGAALGIQNMVFPEVVAGDDDRAAFAFLGSTVAGNHSAPDFQGIWHLYVATTLDGGKTWKTVDVTPNDPVQRAGGVCTNGTSCSGNNRNLLDFMDISVDKAGRVLVGYADGCINACVDGGPNSYTAKAVIARQSGGPRLFAQYDPVEPTVPKAPLLDSALQQASGDIDVQWETPDNGGDPIQSYNIYRGTQAGGEQLIANTGNSKTTYIDNTAAPGTTYYYRISALNAAGEGQRGNEVASQTAQASIDPCALPGVQLFTDQAGDQTGAPADPQVDVAGLYIAEPYFSSDGDQLVFTLQVGDLTILPPNAEWNVIFNGPDGKTYFLDMNTNNLSPAYEYGTVDPGTGGVSTFNTIGTLSARSGYSTDGKIVLVIADSKLGGIGAGDTLTGIHATTQILVGALGTGLLETADDTASASYTLKGNSYCSPNAAPTASLAAESTKGHEPLEVQFDAGASNDPDAGDSIASYTFDFGDGSSPVTQSTPMIYHTYQQVGNYNATVTVTDSRDKRSTNTAAAVIEVKGNKHNK